MTIHVICNEIIIYFFASILMLWKTFPVYYYRSWGPFLETPDNFAGPVSIFSSSLIYQLMVIIGTNLAICFTKL